MVRRSIRRILTPSILVLVMTAVLYAAPLTEPFTYSDSSDLSATSATVWTNLSGSLDVVSNQVTSPADSTFNSGYYGTATRTFGANQYAQLVIKTLPAAAYTCVMVRTSSDAVPNQDHYRACAGGSGDPNTYVIRTLNGSDSTLATTATTWTTNDVIKLGINGTTMQVFKNGTQVGSNVTDANLASGQPGINMGGAASVSASDDFEADDTFTLVGGSTPKGLLLGVLP